MLGSTDTAGPEGNLWFSESGASKIGRTTTSGVMTEFSPKGFGEATHPRR